MMAIVADLQDDKTEPIIPEWNAPQSLGHGCSG
jgi:hypothetical protein